MSHRQCNGLGILLVAVIAMVDLTNAQTPSVLTNPVIWEDYPDLDVFRLGDVFYYSSSTFAYSPGAPVLKSYDLNSWTPVSHSVSTLNFGDAYNLADGRSAYRKGIWASSMQYRRSTDTFYWIGCIDGRTYIWAADGNGVLDRNGEMYDWDWQAYATLPTCYYDCGLFFDEDDTPYVAYGNTQIRVAQLSDDLRNEVANRVVYSGGVTVEGSRMYKVNGTYYILVTRPANEERVLRSKSPNGPYEIRTLLSNIRGPLSSAGVAHQGGMVDTQDGKWYYVGFMDAYPTGRIPVVAPLDWQNGWPVLVTASDGSFAKTYPLPVQTTKSVPPIYGTDNFTQGMLAHEWEWNHNPENSKWHFADSDDESGLVLQTVDVTTNLYEARNTLTHRVIGPRSSGTFHLDVSGMQEGDRAGAVLFRDDMAYIGVWREEGQSRLVMMNGMRLGSAGGSWVTTAQGKVAERGPVLDEGQDDVWVKIEVDVTPAFQTNTQRQATFWYSTDGETFTQLGPSMGLSNSWQYFTAYRYAVFNHATQNLGGEVKVRSFTMARTGA